MSVTTRRLTYDDLAQMPDDGMRYEILDGELFVLPSPETVHQRLVIGLIMLLMEAVRRSQAGEVFVAPYDVKLSDYDVVQPDLIYVNNERRHVIERKCIVGAPDLVVEILSPSTRARDEQRKARLYAALGIHEYWVVDPEQRGVRIFALTDSGYQAVAHDGVIVRSAVLSELEIDIPALFADLS